MKDQNKQNHSLIQNIRRWARKSVMLKLITMLILIIILLVPVEFIKDVIRERSSLSQQAFNEVTQKWGAGQSIKGPILTLPLQMVRIKKIKKDETLVEEREVYQQDYHILPQNLHFKTEVHPSTLQRGIYTIPVYETSIKITGSFLIQESPEIKEATKILANKASITLGIHDLKGVKEQIKAKFGDLELDAKPGIRLDKIITSGVSFYEIGQAIKIGEELSFEVILHLKGSKHLSFHPLGATTEVEMTSNWADPKFFGAFLPQDRSVSDDGFSSYWKIIEVNRNFPQTFTSEEYAYPIQQSAFGVEFLMGVDNYRKITRAAKYAMLTIILTFLVFFLIELTSSFKVHPFQYMLVGIALCIFYLLLLSISEFTSFNMAYIIASAIVIAMISLYSWSVLKKPKFALFLLLGTSIIYLFVFTTLQLQDYALMIGTAGMTLALAITMYVTRKIKWSAESE